MSRTCSGRRPPCAGFPRVSGDEPPDGNARRFPRVSGDEPTDIADLVRAAPFSPRERG